MTSYTTVSEALNALSARGYSTDFNLQAANDCMVCNRIGRSLSPDEFEIDEVHRFEGMTDPGDEMILYAISSPGQNIKGVLLSAYGMYQDDKTSGIVQKLMQRL